MDLARNACPLAQQQLNDSESRVADPFWGRFTRKAYRTRYSTTLFRAFGLWIIIGDGRPTLTLLFRRPRRANWVSPRLRSSEFGGCAFHGTLSPSSPTTTLSNQGAVPWFIALIVLEAVIARARGVYIYRTNDLFGSFALGLTQQLLGAVVKLLVLRLALPTPYAWVWRNARLLDWQPESAATYWLALLGTGASEVETCQIH